MSLTIIATREIGMIDPYQQYARPISNDFAYRNNHAKYESDTKEFEQLSERYEHLSEKAWVRDYTIGYIQFTLLRQKLVKLIEFGEFTGNVTSDNYGLRYKDIEDAQNLKEFFLHSDCDGELGTEQIEVLNKHMQQHSDAILNSGEPGIIKFAEFVKKSVEENVCWKFI